MRLRTGLRPEDWYDVGPSYGGSSRLGGSLVVGASRPAKGAGLTPNQAQPTDVARPVGRPRKPIVGMSEEQAEARRASWRASKRRKRRDQQLAIHRCNPTVRGAQ